MSREVAVAVPDPSAHPVEPSVLGSFRDVPAPRSELGAGLGIWRLDPELVTEDDLDHGYTWLDDAERQQASAYVRAELRRAYLVAHSAARLVLGAATGTPPEEVVWGRHPCPGCGEPHGRPRAEGADLEFSLSHTPGAVVIAVADTPVGIDVERHPEDALGLAKLLHPRETEEIQAAANGTLDGGRATVRFTRAWSRTEAYLKGIGIGLGRDPHLDYLGTDDAPGRSIGDWSVRDVLVPEGYGAAVAVRA